MNGSVMIVVCDEHGLIWNVLCNECVSNECGLLWTWLVMDVFCYKCGLLWALLLLMWSVMNAVLYVVCNDGYVMNVVCNEHGMKW